MSNNKVPTIRANTGETTASGTNATEANVADYLKKHPDFFIKHLNLLNTLDIPHQTGQAVSLVEKQMHVLRQSNKDLKERFNKLLDVARENEGHFEQTKKLVVELFDFHSSRGNLSDLMGIFENLFPTVLAANEYRVIFLDQTDSLSLNDKQVVMINSSTLKDNIPKFANMKKSFCGTLTKDEKTFAFDEQADLIASCAAIPLSHKEFKGLIVIGNFKEGHFYKGMGTMFLDHIGNIISRVISETLTQEDQQSITV